MTNEQIMAITRRYQQAIHTIQGSLQGGRYVIRDTRRPPGRDVLWQGPTQDPQGYIEQLKVEQMRYALEDEQPRFGAAEGAADFRTT